MIANLPLRKVVGAMRGLQWMIGMLVWCLFCSSSFVLAQSATDLLADARLSKLVTIQRGGSPLQQVLQELAQQTGVPLRVARDVASWRACVFVRGTPASQVMQAIAQTFTLAWRANGDAYELYQPAEMRMQQEQQIRQMVTRRRQEVMEALRTLREPGNDPTGMRSLMRSTPQLVAALRALGEEEWQQVLRGRAVLLRADRLQLPRRAANLTSVEIVYNPLRKQWQFVQYAPQVVSHSVWSVVHARTQPASLKTTELFSPAEAAGRVVDKPRNPQRPTVAEVLLALANASGVGVVAEFYPLTMIPNIASPMPSQVSGLIDWLNTAGFYQARRSGNLLLLSAREQVWHRLSDIPRETLERWLGDANRFGLSLSVALEIWRLSDLQRIALAEWASGMAGYYQYDTPVRAQFYTAVADIAQRNLPLLRAAALLPSLANQQLLSGRVVSLSPYNASMRQAYLYATAQVPGPVATELQMKATVERKSEYGAVVLSPLPQGGIQSSVITREVDRLQALQEHLMREQVMGTPHWFRSEVEVVTLILAAGGRVMDQRQVELRRFFPLQQQR